MQFFIEENAVAVIAMVHRVKAQIVIWHVLVMVV